MPRKNNRNNGSGIKKCAETWKCSAEKRRLEEKTWSGGKITYEPRTRTTAAV
jgi:hypothetical protein